MASTYNKIQHDLGITYGSDIIGMMLAKDDKGRMAYKEYDDQYLAQQFFNDQPSYVNVPPERRLPLSQDDWRSGFGLEVYDINDKKRYFSSIGMDMRHKGQGILSYGATSQAVPSTGLTNGYTFSNNGFEDGTTGWAATNVTQSSTQKYNGSYSGRIQGTTQKQDYYTITWNDEYKSKEFTFTMWVYNDAAPITGSRIGINDGIGETWSSYDTTVATWTKLTVTRTLSATATKLWLYIELNTAGDTRTTYFDDGELIATVGINGNPVCRATYNGHDYIGCGTHLWKLNGSTGAFSVVASNFPSAITSLETMTISNVEYLFIALGLNHAYRYMIAAETIGISTAAVYKFQYFKRVYTTALTMYANDGVNTIRSTTNPLSIAWSAQTVVDSPNYDITSLFTQSGALYIGKEDKPYYLNSSGVVQNDLAPECEPLTSSTSGKVVILWQGNIYYAAGDQALLEIGTANTWLSPALFCTNLGDFNGKITGLAADDQWLFAALNNTTKVEIMHGREETIDGTTSWVWHPYQELTMGNCNSIWTSSIYQKRLWIASATAGEALQYIPLPTGYGNITGDANRSFLTGGYFITPYLHGGFKNDNKQGVKVSLMLGHAHDADIYFRVYYEKLGDTSWTEINPTPTFFKGTATNRLATGYVPVDASSNNPVSTMFRLKIAGVTDTTNTSPILLWYQIDSILRPPTGTIIACTVMDVKSFATRDRGEAESGSQGVIKSAIDAAIAATYPVTIYDPDGTARTVNFLSLPSNVERRYPVRKVVGQSIEWYYNLYLQCVSIS